MALALARRDILDRYLNQTLGAAWAFINPLLLMAMYVALFTTVFPPPNRAGQDPIRGVIYILSGLAPWFLTAEVLNRATTAISNHRAALRQIAFPASAIPLKEVFAAAFSFAVALVVLLGLCALPPAHTNPVGLALLPLALLLHGVILVGLAFFLAAAGAFNRDLKDVVGFLTSVGMFVAPILYFPERLKTVPALNAIVQANPFSYVVWTYRDALYEGGVAHPTAWLVTGVFAAVSLSVGLFVFDRLKPRFVEVA